MTLHHLLTAKKRSKCAGKINLSPINKWSISRMRLIGPAIHGPASYKMDLSQHSQQDLSRVQQLSRWLWTEDSQNKNKNELKIKTHKTSGHLSLTIRLSLRLNKILLGKEVRTRLNYILRLSTKFLNQKLHRLLTYSKIRTDNLFLNNIRVLPSLI